MAPNGDIAIKAQRVMVEEGRETVNSQTDTRFRQSGLTVAVSNPVITAIQTTQQMAQAASDTGDSRMKALAAANVAMVGKTSFDAVMAGQGTTINGKDNQILVKKSADGKLESRDADATDKVGGINVSISLGSSKSSSTTVLTEERARASTIAAGNNVSINATGAGQDSDIILQGTRVVAGYIVSLDAVDAIEMLAGRNTAAQQSRNSSQSASIGMSVGTGGLAVTASASGARSSADGNDVSWTTTRVEGGRQVVLNSGGDTVLKGAVVEAPQLTARTGGDLHIESLQDTSRFDSRQQSMGGSLSVGLGAAPVSGSFNASKSKVNSDYASVTEQSGLKAGNQGFDVDVARNTTLKGGLITSAQQAVDEGINRFHTAGTLSTTDIANHADYSAKSVGINVGTGFDPNGKLVPTGTSGGVGSDSDAASSVSRSGISGIAGNKDARTGDAGNGVAKIFDADKVQKEINAQVQITQTFGREAPRVVASYATSQAENLRAQGNEVEARKWDEGGAYRSALHTVVGGLSGGIEGALGSGSAAFAAPTLKDLQANVASSLEKAGADQNTAAVVAQFIATTTAGGIGAIAGGGMTTAIVQAANVDVNNRQFDEKQSRLLTNLKKGRSKVEQDRLDAAACALMRCADGVPIKDQFYDELKRRQDLGENYAEEKKLLLSTGEFVYQPYLDPLRDGLTRYGEDQQRVGGAVSAFVGGLGVIAGTKLAIAGSAGCIPTVISCAAVPAGALLAGISSIQFQDGVDNLFGTYTSNEGRLVMASFDRATFPGDRDPLKDVGIDVGIWTSTALAAKFLPKLFFKETPKVASEIVPNTENPTSVRDDILDSLRSSGADINKIKVVAKGEVDGKMYIDTNQSARSPANANADKVTLVPPEKVADRELKKGLVNSNMANAHAEIGVIQQAFEEGVTKGKDMSLSVTGQAVCGFCRGDIPAAAENAGLKSLTLYEAETGKTFFWRSGMRTLEQKKP